MLFGPKSAEETEKKIKKLENKLEELERKRQKILEEIKKLGKENNDQTMVAISERLLELEKENLEIERKMGIEIVEALENGNRGIIDVTKMNPDIVKKYNELKRELNEMRKQENYWSKIAEKRKLSRAQILNNSYNGVTREIEKTNKKIFSLKKALKK